jgi:anthranilate/para-aminobenzoate synthase component I
VPTFIKELAVAADALRIARAIAQRPGLVVLRSGASGALGPSDVRSSFVACDPVEVSHDLVPGGASVASGWGGMPAAPRWIGAIPYEAMRGVERAAWTRSPEDRPDPALLVPTWQRYDAVIRIDHATGTVAIEADHEGAAARLERVLRQGGSASRGFTLELSRDNEAPAAHLERVRAALAYIAQGDIYQVNLARRIAYDFRGDPFALFASLVNAAPAPYGLYADFGRLAVCASSPELALEVRGDRLRTCPIKGTRPRGADADADGGLARELDADPKERAELTMAIDLHRNDLGRVAATGSVRVLGAPRVLAGPTLWSRVAEIVARRAAGVRDEDIVRAMIPCGSVTGAPKVRAMEIVATLEPFRRGLYTGAFGYVGRDGAIVMAMAIRALEIVGRERAHYFTGGGIVFGSVPERELEETRWKAAQLENIGVFGGAHASSTTSFSWPASVAGGSGGRSRHDEPCRPSSIDD